MPHLIELGEREHKRCDGIRTAPRKKRESRLDLSEACCYGAKSMLRTSRRIFLLLLALVALGGLGYKFRNSITLEGFQWSTVGQSLRDARTFLAGAHSGDDLRLFRDSRAALDAFFAHAGYDAFL